MKPDVLLPVCFSSSCPLLRLEATRAMTPTAERFGPAGGSARPQSLGAREILASVCPIVRPALLQLFLFSEPTQHPSCARLRVGRSSLSLSLSKHAFTRSDTWSRSVLFNSANNPTPPSCDAHTNIYSIVFHAPLTRKDSAIDHII